MIGPDDTPGDPCAAAEHREHRAIAGDLQRPHGGERHQHLPVDSDKAMRANVIFELPQRLAEQVAAAPTQSRE